MIKKKKSAAQAQIRPVTPSVQKTPRTAVPKRSVVIDHPSEGEIVRSADYTVRIGASPTDRAEISVDGKDWQPCRECVGYWWFDWSGYNAGPHTIRVRIPSGKRFLASKPRQFTVLI